MRYAVAIAVSITVFLFVACKTDLIIWQVKFINRYCHPDDWREEGSPSSWTSANKLLLPAECQIAGMWMFAGVLQTAGKWYLSANYLTVRRSLSRCAPSGWHLQVINFFTNKKLTFLLFLLYAKQSQLLRLHDYQ